MDIPIALTVAGSDSSGGAGIQADLKTFARLGVYGLSVITAVTAQNTTGVLDVLDVPPEFVARQLAAVLSDSPPLAMKTGMLARTGTVEAVAHAIREYAIPNIVVDPVLAATSGTSLLPIEAVDTIRQILLPLATLVTPNLAEAEALTGREVRDLAGMEDAARRICGMGTVQVLVKGGHLAGDPIDVFFDGRQFVYLRSERIETRNTHGTGCVLSAAITAHLTRGRSPAEAVKLGKDFVTEAIRNGLAIGRGPGSCNPFGDWDPETGI